MKSVVKVLQVFACEEVRRLALQRVPLNEQPRLGEQSIGFQRLLDGQIVQACDLLRAFLCEERRQNSWVEDESWSHAANWRHPDW